LRAYTLIAVLILLPALLAAPLAAGAQQAAKVPRIGFLSAATSGVSSPALDAFRQGLRELGWVEGQNTVVDYRFTEGRSDRLPDLAAELVQLKVDIIVAEATQGVAAAKNATTTIPIVMIFGSADPVGLGFIASLARPGGNVTGLSYSVGPEIVGKELDLLKEIVPKVRRVAILSNPASPVQSLLIREVNGAARSLGVQLQHLAVRGPNEFEGAFAAMAKERVGALLVVADAVFVFHRKRLADLAAGSAGRPSVASSARSSRSWPATRRRWPAPGPSLLSWSPCRPGSVGARRYRPSWASSRPWSGRPRRSTRSQSRPSCGSYAVSGGPCSARSPRWRSNSSADYSPSAWP
jgi:putative ABC transport system substrate-binding protein